MNETTYRRQLIGRIRDRFPGCVVMKNDPTQLQGVPDILILNNRSWAMLEIKMAENSGRQPNQEHYIRKFGEMSFASFINPDTEEEVLNDLQLAFGLAGSPRIS